MRPCLAALLVLAACFEPVREDRTIEWSQRGDRVTFQHRDEGVYVADAEGGAPEKIFEPDEAVLASSTPLWDPAGERLIFTTAIGGEGGGERALRLLAGDDPAGNLFHRQPITYTCWLKNKRGRPRALFHAELDHVGYVAANLAVRWHPSGGSLLYLKDAVELHRFDLASRRSTRVFPHEAKQLLFDYSPDGKHLACVADTGIWIDTWRVADVKEDVSLEHLRGRRPAWRPDSGVFAFATENTLRLGDPKRRSTRKLAKGEFRDLRWAPDGQRLGAVRGTDLHIVANDRLGPPRNHAPVRRFAGWNARGDRFAYTSPDDIPHAGGPLWSMLLVPDAKARDAVHEVSADGDRIVFSGMRVTFPNWSPTEDKLSLWFTFAPTHRAPLSRLLGWGLRPGDPAAVFEPATGAIRWMAVSAFEEAQVGHYHLLKRNHDEAWRWYEKAKRAQPRHTFAAALRRPNEFPFFQYVCLRRLGRHDEAAQRLAQFRETFLPVSEQEQQLWNEAARALLAPGSLLGELVRDIYAAEVFLSLDASDEALAFLEPTTLSRALARGQVLLLRGEHEAFAKLATETIAPQLLALEPQPFVTELVMAFGLFPMFSRDFVRGRDLTAKWEQLREKARDDTGRLMVDLVLRACGDREAARRAKASPAPAGLLPKQDVDEWIGTMRKVMTMRWR